MMIKKYRVVTKRYDHCPDIGDIVYDCRGYDYGTSSDDSRVFKEEFISVTYNQSGDYPFVTIPVADIEEIKD